MQRSEPWTSRGPAPAAPRRASFGLRIGPVLAATGSLMILSPPLLGQAIQGEVRDAGSLRGIGEVVIQVLLEDEVTASTTTDAAGSFSVFLRRAGTYRLRAVRLGYGSAESDLLEVGVRELVEVTLEMPSLPIPLAGVTVEARRRDPRHDASYEGLYARRATALSVGTARVVVRGDPEMEVSGRVRDVIQWFVPPRGCVTYYLDGRPGRGLDFFWEILDLHPSMLEGIEYYRDGGLPVGFEPGWSERWRPRAGEPARTRPSVASGCSVIAVWRARPGIR
jgi:hypothetical protein